MLASLQHTTASAPDTYLERNWTISPIAADVERKRESDDAVVDCELAAGDDDPNASLPQRRLGHHTRLVRKGQSNEDLWERHKASPVQLTTEVDHRASAC